MARTYTWVRSVNTLATSPNGRARFSNLPYPAGSTLERVIVGWALWLDYTIGPSFTGPNKSVQIYGVYNQLSTEGSPDVDPGQQPNLDWLWAGAIAGQVLPLYFAGTQEGRMQWASPPEQIDVTARRRNDTAGANRVWLITDTLASVDSGATDWDGVAYMSILYSQPA